MNSTDSWQKKLYGPFHCHLFKYFLQICNGQHRRHIILYKSTPLDLCHSSASSPHSEIFNPSADSDKFIPGLLSSSPQLDSLIKKIESIEQVKEYLNSEEFKEVNFLTSSGSNWGNRRIPNHLDVE